MLLRDCGIRDIVFTHIYEEVQTVFNITKLHADPAFMQLEVCCSDIDINFAKTWLPLRGIEPHRLQRIKKFLAAGGVPEPLTFVDQGQHQLMVDGTHRYQALYEFGVSLFPLRLCPPELWKKYVVEDMPLAENEEQIINSFSGIL